VPREGKASSPFARALREVIPQPQKKQRTAPPEELAPNTATETTGAKKFLKLLS
jgi:hypothetical protein